jgi:hypothetical protein
MGGLNAKRKSVAKNTKRKINRAKNALSFK